MIVARYMIASSRQRGPAQQDDGVQERRSGRPGQRGELAPLYVFLATDDSRYMSGELLRAGGCRLAFASAALALAGCGRGDDVATHR